MEELVYKAGRKAAYAVLVLLGEKPIAKMLCKDYNRFIKKMKKDGLVLRSFKPKKLKRNSIGLIPKESGELYKRILFELLSFTSFMVIINATRFFESKEPDIDGAHNLVDSFSLGYLGLLKDSTRDIELLNVLEIKELIPQMTFGLGNEKLNLAYRIKEYWNCWEAFDSDAKRFENALSHFVMCYVNVFEDTRIWGFLPGLSNYSTYCLKIAKDLVSDSLNGLYNVGT